MVNTVTAEKPNPTPQLPPKRQNKHNTVSYPIIVPVNKDHVVNNIGADMSPPTYDAPPPPIRVDRLHVPNRKDDLGKLSDGEDYIELESKNPNSEAIYTSLEGDNL